MSDDAGAETKKRRGRPAKADTGDKPKAEKRARTDADSGPPAKKGRGRPKGSGGGRRRKGRKSPAKKATTGGRSTGGRGRPKKAAPPAEEPDKSEQSSGAEQGEDE